MAKISLAYPDTGLTISITVKNRDTGTTVFTGTMTESDSSKVYKYDFTEEINTDYVYTATVTGYSDMSGTIYRDGGGLTTEQDAELTQIYNRVDENVSAIAVGWNPYIEGVSGLKKGIQKIVDKVEDKGNEVIKEIQESENDIVKTIKDIPGPKEPIVNVTTEKIDTEGFMKAIKGIPAPIVNVTTETVSIEPIIKEIKAIGKIEDIKFPEYPEQKVTDMSGMECCMKDMMQKIDNLPDNTEKIDKITEFVEKKQQKEDDEEKMKEEEEIMNRPLPNSFIAKIN